MIKYMDNQFFVLLVFNIDTNDGQTTEVVHKCDYSFVKSLAQWLHSLRVDADARNQINFHLLKCIPKITMEWGELMPHNHFGSTIDHDTCGRLLDTRIVIDLTEYEHHEKTLKMEDLHLKRQFELFDNTNNSLVCSLRLKKIIAYISPKRYTTDEYGNIQTAEYYKTVEEFIEDTLKQIKT